MSIDDFAATLNLVLQSDELRNRQGYPLNVVDAMCMLAKAMDRMSVQLERLQRIPDIPASSASIETPQ